MLTIYNQFEQNTELWLLARLGLPTTSCFKTIMARGVGQAASKTRDAYLNELVAELKRGEPNASYKYSNPYMDRGHEWEPDALAMYIRDSKEPVTKVAFIRNHEIGCGCSPDGLVGDKGGVEVKTLLPGLMMRHLRAPSADAHMAQLQGSMWVTGREWWDLVYYCPGDIDVIRVGREPAWADEFKRFLAPFMAELEQAVLDVTKGMHTFKALRALRDKQFLERLDQDSEGLSIDRIMQQRDVEEDHEIMTPPVSAIRAALEKSLEREKFLEDGE